MLRPGDLGLSIKPSFNPNTSPEDTLAWNVQCKGATQFEDCLGVCRFNTRTDLKLLAEALSTATGWSFSIEEAMIVGRRIVNLLRVFNIRHGHTAEMDAPAPRYGSMPEEGLPEEKNVMNHWDDMRGTYYEQMGWDRETGKPMPDTLKDLGLDSVIGEMWGS